MRKTLIIAAVAIIALLTACTGGGNSTISNAENAANAASLDTLFTETFASDAKNVLITWYSNKADIPAKAARAEASEVYAVADYLGFTSGDATIEGRLIYTFQINGTAIISYSAENYEGETLKATIGDDTHDVTVTVSEVEATGTVSVTEGSAPTVTGLTLTQPEKADIDVNVDGVDVELGKPSKPEEPDEPVVTPSEGIDYDYILDDDYDEYGFRQLFAIYREMATEPGTFDILSTANEKMGSYTVKEVTIEGQTGPATTSVEITKAGNLALDGTDAGIAFKGTAKIDVDYSKNTMTITANGFSWTAEMEEGSRTSATITGSITKEFSMTQMIDPKYSKLLDADITFDDRHYGIEDLSELYAIKTYLPSILGSIELDGSGEISVYTSPYFTFASIEDATYITTDSGLTMSGKLVAGDYTFFFALTGEMDGNAGVFVDTLSFGRAADALKAVPDEVIQDSYSHR